AGREGEPDRITDRLTLLNNLAQTSRKPGREGGEALRIDRRMITRIPADGNHHLTVLHELQATAGGSGQDPVRDPHPALVAEHLRIDPVTPRRVSQPDLDLVADQPGIAELLQPDRHP